MIMLYGEESGLIKEFAKDTPKEEINKYIKDLKRFDKENNINEKYYLEIEE